MRYALIIERAPRNYAACVPALPGCVSTGASEEEVTRLIGEAIALRLAGLREDGLPLPEPQSTVAVVEVPAPVGQAAPAPR